MDRFSYYRRKLGTNIRSKWFWIIFTGYFLRILVMGTSGQHDIMFMGWQAHFINLGHTNLYLFLSERFGEIVSRPIVWSPYPYGFYAFTSIWLFILEHLHLIDLANWASPWETYHPARTIFLFKSAYLPFDLLIGYLLYHNGGRRIGRVSWGLWAWSPIAVYTPFLMGQNDIYPTAFMVAGIYSAARSIRASRSLDNPNPSFKFAVLSTILLGLGATFKIYPLLLLPALVILLSDNWFKRAGLLSLGLTVFAISCIPFLATPNFRNSVLLNPEGIKLINEVQILGVPIVPFLVLYIVLIIFLTFQDPQIFRPSHAWSISLIILASIFLLVPVPIYWWIWIVPLLIASTGRNPKLSLLLFSINLAFGILLLKQHRELGVGLPIHLSDEFNLPNIPTTLSLHSNSIFTQGLALIWSIMNSAFIASLGIAVYFSIQSLKQKKRQMKAQPFHHNYVLAHIIPMAVMFLGLALNLFLAKDLVSQSYFASWNNLELSNQKPDIQQSLKPISTKVNGIRLRYTHASESSQVLKACLHESEEFGFKILACSTTSVGQTIEGKYLYFVFDEPVVVTPENIYLAKVKLENQVGTITLPYATKFSSQRQLWWGGESIQGSIDISLLHSFGAAKAFNILVTRNIIRDPPLLATILIATLGILFLVAKALDVQKQEIFYQEE